MVYFELFRYTLGLIWFSYLFEVAIFLVRRSWAAFVIQSENTVCEVLVATVRGYYIFAFIRHPACGLTEVVVVVDAAALHLVHQFVPH